MISELLSPTGWCAVAGLWWMAFWLYRDYRLDLFRERMFSLRDHLFDLAAAGELPFESQAYGMLRSTLNANIQYGHHCGFVQLLTFYLLNHKIVAARRITQHFRQHWHDACAPLQASTVTELERIRAAMHVLITEQIVVTSFPVFFIAPMVVPPLGTFIAGSLLRRYVNRIKVNRALTWLECSTTACVES